jgi:hypothetical protein
MGDYVYRNMLKSEIVFRELLESPDARFTQLGLSRSLGFSISTVNNAVRPLSSMGAVKILPRGLRVIDREKLLYYMASVRDLDKDVIYSTRANLLPSEVEKQMPAGVVYTAYSAYRFRFDSVPADYGEVYVYSREGGEVERRFPKSPGPPNLFVLRIDRRLEELSEDGLAPNSQVFADLWNMREWYAREYVRELGGKILA